MAKKVIPLSRIVIDRGTQSRVAINEDTVKEYTEAMARQVVFPPMLVYYDKSTDEYILADGFHRYHALKKVAPGSDVTVDRRFGTAQHALWASIIANQSHGLPRTTADKRNATRLALLHPNGAEMSNRQIGRHLGIDHVTVGSVRREMELSGEIHQIESRTVTRNGTTYQQNTTNIGRPQEDPTAACSNCDFYNGRTCITDEKEREPWTEGCEDYEPKRAYKPALPPPPPADHENIRAADSLPEDRQRIRNPHPYRKRTGRVSLLVSPDDPQLCAIELRNNFSREFLVACYRFLQHLWTDEEIAD